ncbi:LON peptidase substrate-binding domain-containing protein [Brevundimonas sp. LjRoot202]|uniref:LON peptidase substrate-binding domain-containing protein n=1 Tax=Brevundimonas sp. LjRoot202 TaxID=3342281 RepID=UPI003ECCE619
MAQGYVRAVDLPQVIPVFPLPGAILLPRGQLPLNIFEPRYLNMIDDAMAGDRIIGMIQPQGSQSLPGLSPVGCAGRITSFAETSDGRYLITLTGCARFRLAAELPTQTPYRQIRADFAPFEADLAAPPVDDVGLDRDTLLDALRAYLETRGLDIDWDTAETAPPEALINSLSMALPFEPAEKQALLEAVSLTDRSDVLTALLTIDAADDGEGDTPSIQ